MKFQSYCVMNIENALRGMRNAKESWGLSDSGYCQGVKHSCICCSKYDICNEKLEIQNNGSFVIGSADLRLAQQLIKAGKDHRKFLRQIFVSVDITAPLYFWKEFDTYKVGVVRNSCSTMHKLASTQITKERFEHAELLPQGLIEELENIRLEHNACTEMEQKKKLWKTLIVTLPSSWLQKSTITLNFEVLLHMMKARANHRLTEWQEFIDWAKTLPYADDLLIEV